MGLDPLSYKAEFEDRCTMLRVSREDLGEDVDLLDYLSDSTDVGNNSEEYVNKKCMEIETPLVLSESFSKTFVVAGLPIVKADKYDRFVRAVRTIMNQTLKLRRIEYNENFLFY